MSRRERREREEREEKERKRQEKLEKKKRRNKKEDKEDKEPKEPKKRTNKNRNNKRDKRNKKERKESNLFVRILKGILKFIIVILLIIILIFGIIIGYLGFSTNWNFDKMVRKGVKEAAMIMTGQSQEDLDNLDPIYCLVMGVSVDIDVELTDTIILCAYYPKTQQASMLSIPRDTFVGYSESTAASGDKINSLYSYGGPEKTVAAVEKLTGLEIPNYLVINTKSLIKVIDEIGGVDFDVPIDMDYDDPAQDLYIHLQAGYQRIDGSKAEQLLRFRHNNDGSSYSYEYGDNDIGRMKTQREFIMETVKQTIKFKNITKINNLVDIAFENVETNANMDEVLKYTPAVMDFDVSAIKTDVLPGTPRYMGPYNLSFYDPSQSKTQAIVEEMFSFDRTLTKDDVSIAPEKIKVQVLNGCADETKTQNVVDKLTEVGYKVENAGLKTVTKSTKVIKRTEKTEKIINDLMTAIGQGNLEVGKDYTKCDFTIVVGQDYAIEG